jgi:glycosyltransferase involved in cell wall biosynthesis
MIDKLHKIRSLLFPKRRQVIRLTPKHASCGCVVISYITWPFVEGVDSPKMRGHTNAYEVTVMAQAFLDLGFRVEVCDYDDESYRLPQDCRLAIDIHGNLERWELPAGCKRILHATGPHWLFWNHAELSRMLGIQSRHGVALKPQRHVKPSRGVEVADEVVVLGNEFTRGTFLFGGKPVTRVPISSAYEFAWLEGRDFERAKKKFLWVGSYGMVHKGLDLALDAFFGMPDLELTVCGRPEKEADFFRLYEKHLKQRSNIKLHGWLDMASPDFVEIARTHAAVIYPSSAEGGAGSVIHCMHAGMLPICTTEASIDLGNFGVHVESASVESVQKACRAVAEMSSSEVERRARGAYKHVRREHTREKFQENYRKFATKITGNL